MSKRVCAPLDKIPHALEKTGFLLEYFVAEEFRKAGWGTIGGHYYADDIDGRARELDLVAYRATKSKELDVVTAVLVSCKKDEEATWTFLTKERPEHDPNFDWNPVHYWTDLQPLRSYLAVDSWKEGYIKAAGNLYEINFEAKKEIFAFQQVASLKVTPKNDKSIFDSISSLMKALDHEVQAAQVRAKGKKRIYIFSLLSVVDAPMVDVSYSGGTPIAIEVEKITHLARYMVRKRYLSALIHFVRNDKLPEFVGALSGFAEANGKHMISLVEKAYESIRSNKRVREYFSERLKPRLIWEINSFFRRVGRSSTKAEEAQLGYEDGKLLIEVDIYDNNDLEELNADGFLGSRTVSLLREVARYEGDFVFVCDIPF